jgi:acetoin utilization protein AcuB
MYIAASMTTDPLCLHPEMSLRQVRDMVTGKSFRHFPVTDAAGRLVGMVSDRDLRSASPSTALNPVVRQDQLERLGQVRVDAIMSRPPIALPRDATLDDALLLFDRHSIGAIPVVDHDGRLVGIITVRDVLSAYRRLFGIGGAGSSLVEVLDDGRPHLMSRIASALDACGITCTRLVRADGGEAPGTRPGTVYARVLTYNIHAVHAALRAAGLETASRKPAAPPAGAPHAHGDRP